MANIKEIAARHKINLDIKDSPYPSPSAIPNPEKNEGRLRRPWLEDTSKTQSSKIESKQGLNLVETEAINPVKTQLEPGLNGVDQPHLETEFKLGLNRVKDFRGNPLKVMLYLVSMVSSEEPYVTEKISVTDIAENAGLSRESVKTALKFLIKKQVIKRLISQTGLHGWTSYKLQEAITEDFIKQGLNRVKTGSISSSSNYKTTTNIDGDKNNTLINIEPLRQIGINYSHIVQILNQQKLTVEMIQDSVYAFAYDLKYNNKAIGIKASPLNYFMGILRSGQVYAPPENYELPEQEAMRLYLERKKAQEAQKEQMEKEIFDLHFKEWLGLLTEGQIKEIVPNYSIEKGVTGMTRGFLLDHFKQYEWIKLKESIVNNTTK